MNILEGIRIVDFTRYATGPQITLTLAFMGAEVIRIESNAELDHFRRPESAVSYGSTRAGHDSFNTLNLNKLSVTINLKTKKGQPKWLINAIIVILSWLIVIIQKVLRYYQLSGGEKLIPIIQ